MQIDKAIELKDLTTAQLTELQTSLNTLGFNVGTADGLYGDKTLKAWYAFKRSVNQNAAATLSQIGPGSAKALANAVIAKPKQLVSKAQAEAVFGRKVTDAQIVGLNDCLHRFSINTNARIRHFLAQIAHESAGLKYMVEIASGAAYEGRRDLGNVQPGDGKRFKGVSPLQMTGRHNYQRFANYVQDQGVMAGWQYVARVCGFLPSGFWWMDNGLNNLIDKGSSCRKVSARVNGRDPANGLKDREFYYAKALKLFP